MRIKTMMLLLLCFGLSQFGYAQTQGVAKDQSDLAGLRADVRALQAEQQQVLSRLDELKQILQGNGQPPPTAITSMNVRGESFRGDSGARVAIIEYADFECPYCGEYARKVFPQLLSDYIATGKVKYFYRDLPMSGHARALPAARAARCAGEQGKYWGMHDSIFAMQNALSAPALLDRAKTLGLGTAKFTECQSSEKYAADIQKNLSEAQTMGIGGTPTFFLGVVNAEGNVAIGKQLAGAAPFDVFKVELDAMLGGKQEAR